MKKQLLTLLLACIASISASAYDFEVDGIYYNINGSEAEVTCRDDYKYSGSVTIPESVTYNGTTYSVTSIGREAFKDCRSLKLVTIPNSVTTIGGAAFENCSALTSVTIPDSVISIEWSTFYKCSGLTSVTIGNSVTTIGKYAFVGCISLTSVTIPDSVTSIGEAVFYNCSSLEAFYGKYASADNRCLIVGRTLNSFAPSGLTTYSIPESITSIGNYTFNGCNNLTSVTIPNSVTSIGWFAFEGCSGLTALTVKNDNPNNISLGGCVFDYVPKKDTCILYVPEGSEGLYAVADQWKDFKNIVGIEISGIEEVSNDEPASLEAPYYDLMGRRVKNPTHGIYIQNGKKILVK